MWPTIFEFSWDTGHMIFFGVFYAVVIVIATSIMYAVIRSIVDTFSDGGDAQLGQEPKTGTDKEITERLTAVGADDDCAERPRTLDPTG